MSNPPKKTTEAGAEFNNSQQIQAHFQNMNSQLLQLARFAGVEMQPRILEIIVDLIRMNVDIPVLANMIKTMCSQSSRRQPRSDVVLRSGTSSSVGGYRGSIRAIVNTTTFSTEAMKPSYSKFDSSGFGDPPSTPCQSTDPYIVVNRHPSRSRTTKIFKR